MERMSINEFPAVIGLRNAGLINDSDPFVMCSYTYKDQSARVTGCFLSALLLPLTGWFVVTGAKKIIEYYILTLDEKEIKLHGIKGCDYGGNTTKIPNEKWVAAVATKDINDTERMDFNEITISVDDGGVKYKLEVRAVFNGFDQKENAARIFDIINDNYLKKREAGPPSKNNSKIDDGWGTFKTK